MDFFPNSTYHFNKILIYLHLKFCSPPEYKLSILLWTSLLPKLIPSAFKYQKELLQLGKSSFVAHEGNQAAACGQAPTWGSSSHLGVWSRGRRRQKEAWWYVSTNAFSSILNILCSLQLSFYPGITRKGNIDSGCSDANKETSWEKETLMLAVGASSPVPSLSHQLTAWCEKMAINLWFSA